MSETDSPPPAPDAAPVSTADIMETAIRMRQPASAEALLFNYIYNGANPKPRHLPSLMKIFDSIIELGHLSWPLEMRGMCMGKDVLDFGCGATLYGAAFRAIGAKTYTGVDQALDPTRKRARSRTRKQTVSLSFSLSDVSTLIPGLSYLRADGVSSREAWDVALLQSVTPVLQDPAATIAQLHRSLRPDGQIWILHENFYAWGGHGKEPRMPAAFDATKPEHVALADWGHVVPPQSEPGADAGAEPPPKPLRLSELRELVSTYFEISKWQEVADRSVMRARLTDTVRRRLTGYSDFELLTKQVIIAGRKRGTVLS